MSHTPARFIGQHVFIYGMGANWLYGVSQEQILKPKLPNIEVHSHAFVATELLVISLLCGYFGYFCFKNWDACMQVNLDMNI